MAVKKTVLSYISNTHIGKHTVLESNRLSTDKKGGKGLERWLSSLGHLLLDQRT